MAQGKAEKGVAETSKPLSADKRTPKALKPEPKIVKKSPNKYSARANEAKGTQQINTPNQSYVKTKAAKSTQVKVPNQNSAKLNEVKCSPRVKEKLNGETKDACEGEKGKDFINESNKERSQNYHSENLGGLIFMCSAKTKPECFRYMVMGLPAGRQDLVMSIKPGLNLFLYDFNLRLMYGIYKASSAGGMKLEPSAFNGAFPAQVRFKIHKECLPLPENIFKNAIKENYRVEKRNMFKTELTVHQVQKLTKLFQATPQSQSSSHSVQVPPVVLALLPLPRPVTLVPPPEAQKESLLQHPYSLDQTKSYYNPRGYLREHLPNYAASTLREMKPVDREPKTLDPLSLGEKEYRTYGLRREPTAPSLASAPIKVPYWASAPAATPAARSSDPYPSGRNPYHPFLYNSTSADPNSQLSIREETSWKLSPKLPRGGTFLSDSVHLGRRADLSRRREDKMEYKMQGVAAQQASAHLDNFYSGNAAKVPDYDRQQPQLQLDREPAHGSMPVSARYSFAGPSLSYR